MYRGFEKSEVDDPSYNIHTKENSKVMDIYRLRLIKELKKALENEASDVIISAELKFLSIGMLERIMIDYGLGDKIEARYVSYNGN